MTVIFDLYLFYEQMKGRLGILQERTFMIRNIIVVAVLMMSSMGLQAQGRKGYEVPDYGLIKRVTKDKSSPSYYPKLFARYTANDTTLNTSDYRMLYYGYFFEDGYRVFGSVSKFDDSLKAIFKKKDINNDDRRNAIRYTLDDLKTSPFNLKDIYRLYNLFDLFKDKNNTAIYLRKLEMLAKVISSTGDAMTDTTGLHVLSVEDEYTVVSLLGYEFGGSQKLVKNKCDYLTLAKNDDGLEGLYFDVRQIIAKEQEALNGK